MTDPYYRSKHWRRLRAARLATTTPVSYRPRDAPDDYVLRAQYAIRDKGVLPRLHPDGALVFAHACKMGVEGIVSKRLGSRYRSGRSPDWLKFKNPEAPAVKREAEEEWGARNIRSR